VAQEDNTMPKKALVVDNDFFFVEFLSELLEGRGYEVEKAYNGKEAIEKLEQHAIDLFFGDLIMPKIDGKQVIRFIRNRFPEAAFPVIALSGVIIENLDELDDISADYFVAKGPIETMSTNIEALLDKIEQSPLPGEEDEKVILPQNLISRQVTYELMRNVKYLQAVFDHMGIGVIVADRDARIISINSRAALMVDQPLSKLLNRPVVSLFAEEDRATTVTALKQLAREPEANPIRQTVSRGDRRFHAVITLLRIDNEPAGWIITMEDVNRWEEPA
jgi:PAS domain S-box-containing protein